MSWFFFHWISIFLMRWRRWKGSSWWRIILYYIIVIISISAIFHNPGNTEIQHINVLGFRLICILKMWIFPINKIGFWFLSKHNLLKVYFVAITLYLLAPKKLLQLMLMLMLWPQAVTPEFTHFTAYHPLDSNLRKKDLL